jgi:hypothetical protein
MSVSPVAQSIVNFATPVQHSSAQSHRQRTRCSHIHASNVARAKNITAIDASSQRYSAALFPNNVNAFSPPHPRLPLRSCEPDIAHWRVKAPLGRWPPRSVQKQGQHGTRASSKKLTVRIFDRPASRPRLRMVQKAHAALPSAWIKCAKACAGLVAGRVARSVS